jgi:ABC-type lipoprotein release transport system permease subunit
MLGFRPLPWEYGVRNLLRRPTRSALTLACLTLVVLLVFVVVGFVRGLETTLAVSGDPRVVVVHSLGASENVENSSIPRGSAALLTASLPGVERRTLPDGGQAAYASEELYLGTNVTVEGDTQPTLGLVRGVTPTALLVRRTVQLVEGDWPKPGEVVVGRLVAAKLGRDAAALAVGRRVTFEGREWRVSGRFAAGGSALESELWCPLDDLQQAMKRQDISLVAVALAPGARYADVDNFCRERLDLEMQATPETAYYESLAKHYRPVRMLAWLVVGLVAGAGVFAGLNTMYGAVVGRVRELAALQTLGFTRRAVALSLVQEGVLLAAAAALLAAAVALGAINGRAVRFTMGAFALRVDSVAVLIGCGVGLAVGALGSVPPALRALRMPIAEGLKAV